MNNPASDNLKPNEKLMTKFKEEKYIITCLSCNDVLKRNAFCETDSWEDSAVGFKLYHEDCWSDGDANQSPQQEVKDKEWADERGYSPVDESICEQAINPKKDEGDK